MTKSISGKSAIYQLPSSSNLRYRSFLCMSVCVHAFVFVCVCMRLYTLNEICVVFTYKCIRHSACLLWEYLSCTYIYAYILFIYLARLHPQCVSLTSVKCFTCGVGVLSPHSQSICMYIQEMNG